MIRPYGIVFALVLAALAVAGATLYTRTARPAETSNTAEPYREALRTKLLAQPWPDDPQRIADLGGALDWLGGYGDTDLLAAIYANQRMHAAGGDAPPAHASVGDALRWLREARTAHRNTVIDPEFELLWDRVLTRALALEPGTADAAWPAWMPADLKPDQFHHAAAGAWVANDARQNRGALTTIFPLRVTNRGAVPLAAIDGNVTFYYPEAQRPGMPRPGAAMKCPLALRELAPGASTLVACAFSYTRGANDAVERSLEFFEHARSGRLQMRFEARTAPESPLWQLPKAARPALDAELNEYGRLQEADQQRARHAASIDTMLMQTLFWGGLFAFGYALAGALDRLDRRPRLGPVVGVLALGFVGVIAVAAIYGGSGYGPIVYGVIGSVALATLAIGFFVGRVLAPLGAKRAG